MIEENKIFTLVLRKDIFNMTRDLQEIFNCLEMLDNTLKEKLAVKEYQYFTYALNALDRTFKRLEYYDQYGDSFVREEVKDDKS